MMPNNLWFNFPAVQSSGMIFGGVFCVLKIWMLPFPLHNLNLWREKSQCMMLATKYYIYVVVSIEISAKR